MKTKIITLIVLTGLIGLSSCGTRTVASNNHQANSFQQPTKSDDSGMRFMGTMWVSLY